MTGPIEDPVRIGEEIGEHWKTFVGCPYHIGREFHPPERGGDCSGLMRNGFMRFSVWPFDNEKTLTPMDRDETADGIWKGFVPVPFEERRAGDVVCFGDKKTSHASHCVGVITPDLWVGANSGRPMRAAKYDDHGGLLAPAETVDEYVAAMAANDARVKLVSASYWALRRLGVVRAPLLSTPGK